MVMLSHIITFVLPCIAYLQSLYLTSLPPGVFPVSLLTDCFSVVGVALPPSVLHQDPLLPLQQQFYQTPSCQFLL